MSYAHMNDRHDNNYLSRFRDRLEGEVRVQLGKNDFHLFQDRTHITTGQQWAERIAHYLSQSAIFVPILAPHYFESRWCRKEFHYFWNREQNTGSGHLVFPVHYMNCIQIAASQQYPEDSMEYRLAKYEFADWRALRHFGLRTLPAKRRLEMVASHIVGMFERLESTPLRSGGNGSSKSSNDFADPMATPPGGQFGPPFDLRMLAREYRLHGRSNELGRVMENLDPAGGRRIVCIEGEPGIGKTLLATEAMRLLRMDGNFQDGIAVVLCSGTGNPPTILRDALARFDSQRRPPVATDAEGLFAEGRRLLAGKDTAIIFDDLELSQDMARMLELLYSTGVAILITSLNGRALASVASAIRVKLTPMLPNDGMDFFTDPNERRPPHA
ncbi:MAG TPA: TIR domain-containing protein [Ktedonobacterales bacterium]|nr:TIR domain-containing protein [Ktedonobacterales bacterium]